MIAIGKKVKFLGGTDSQVSWGRGIDPRPLLEIGNTYFVSASEQHTWHGLVSVEGVDGKFNDVMFEEVAGN